MPNWTGILELDAEDRQGKTVTKNVYFRGAFKIMRPVYHNQSNQPCYYLLNPGGGYLDGDTYRLRVTLDDHSKITLTTQSATKVYKTPLKHAYQETEIYLKKGSYMEYLPDPLIAYKDARYVQKNIIHMERGASFLYADILTPGWSPEGQHFSYHSLRLLNEIYLDDELIVFDHIHLKPKEWPMNGIGFLEGYTHMGSFIIVGDQASSGLLEQLYDVIDQEPGDYKAGLTNLFTKGIVIRVMANSTQMIERIFSACHHLISQEWHGKKPSFLRKY
ncbi:urease accessory protein UreD [Lederbergia panacisoli]|uniref:urease accessory protein UreD n=1 Tax=Lederbergia panacisoli TaxID=1255251 RepID=UPI00214C96E3|nr:urease accessory protein UreD [Lederbergia panacisoli]MCR2821582.1 urease accessory protein UreD [Lederbergia panacisoli]